MKLYYTPTSCGAASFISAFAANLMHIECEQVDLKTHTTTSGADFYTINKKGNVPALVLDDGTVLNEGAVVLQYLADLAPGTVAPVNGTQDRYLVQQALNYIGTEIHTNIGGLFHPAHNDATREFYKTNAHRKLAFLDKELENKTYFVCDKFTVADAYLYIVLSWTAYVGIDTSAYPNINAYSKRIGELDFVKAAHERMATCPTHIVAH